MERRLSKNSLMTAEFDWILFILSAIISIFGLFMVYSTTRSFGTNTNIIVQSVAWVLGMGSLFVFCFGIVNMCIVIKYTKFPISYF